MRFANPSGDHRGQHQILIFSSPRRYQHMFGDCQVSQDFPLLHQWVAEQKNLFKLVRMGKEGLMQHWRLVLLLDAGVDFFAGDCCPNAVTLDELKEFAFLASTSPNSWRFDRSDDLSNQCEIIAKFEKMKRSNGHSLVLATDSRDVYSWFFERYVDLVLRDRNLSIFTHCIFHSRFVHPRRSQLMERYIDQLVANPEGANCSFLLSLLSYFDDEGTGGLAGEDGFKTIQEMITWLNYCERLAVFKGE